MDETFINFLNKLATKFNISFSKGILTLLQQEHPQKENELGYKIYAFGKDFRFMGFSIKAFFKLEQLASLLSKVDQIDGKSLIRALKPAMLALVQHMYLENPCIGVKLLFISFLSSIVMLTTLLPTYIGNIMRWRPSKIG